MFLCNPMLAEQTTKKEKRTRGKKKKKRKALSLPPHIHSRLYQTGGYSWLFINGSQGEMFADKTNTFFSFFFFFSFLNKHHGGLWKELGMFERRGPAAPFRLLLAQLLRRPRRSPLRPITPGSGPLKLPPPSQSCRWEPSGASRCTSPWVGGRRETSKALLGAPVTKWHTGVCGSLWLGPLAIWSFSSSSGFSPGFVALLP